MISGVVATVLVVTVKEHGGTRTAKFPTSMDAIVLVQATGVLFIGIL